MAPAAADRPPTYSRMATAIPAGAQHRKDNGQNESPPQVDPVALPIDPIELAADRRFLTKVLCDLDAAHSLLDEGVDAGHGAEPLAGNRARRPSKNQRHHEHHRHHDQQPRNQAGFDAGQDNEQHQGLDDLAEQIGDQHDDLGVLGGVGGDPADDLARGQLVVEREIVLRRRGKTVRAQGQHDIGHGAAHQPPTDPISAPDYDGQHQYQQRQKHHPRPDSLRGHGIHAAGNQDRQHRPGQRDDQDHSDRHDQSRLVGPEIGQHAPNQVPVAVRAIVGFGVQAFEEAHA